MIRKMQNIRWIIWKFKNFCISLRSKSVLPRKHFYAKSVLCGKHFRGKSVFRRKHYDRRLILKCVTLLVGRRGGVAGEVSRVRAKFCDWGCTGATSPINKGLAPSSEGCHGCHKGATERETQTRDPPLPSLFREGVLSLFSAYSVHSACGIKLSLELKLALAVINSLENLLLPMILCIASDDSLRKII